MYISKTHNLKNNYYINNIPYDGVECAHKNQRVLSECCKWLPLKTKSLQINLSRKLKPKQQHQHRIEFLCHHDTTTVFMGIHTYARAVHNRQHHNYLSKLLNNRRQAQWTRQLFTFYLRLPLPLSAHLWIETSSDSNHSKYIAFELKL